MPRAIWKGHISFGLVNIPVALYAAESPRELRFNLLDVRNKARVRYERVNEETGEPVPWDQIVKAYQHEDEYVLLSDEDFKKAAVESTQTVEIMDFVKADDIGPLFFEKPYYLAPGKKGEKGYVLLRETLARTKMTGVAKVVIHTRQHLAAVMPHENALVMVLLRFPNELRGLDDLDLPAGGVSEHGINARELEMATRLVESMTSKWRPEKYHDEYREALLKWIARKAAAGDTAPLPEGSVREPAAPATVNIMDLLRRSVEESARSRGKAGAGGSRKKAPSRRRRRAG